MAAGASPLFVSPGQRGQKSFAFLAIISRLVLTSKIDLLLDHFPLRVLCSFHSASHEVLLGALVAGRAGCRFALYNFGTTAFQARLSDYAFQNADVFFAWSRGSLTSIMTPTTLAGSSTSDSGDCQSTAKYSRIANGSLWTSLDFDPDTRLVVFYDIPYFPDRSLFTPRLLRDFYRAALACADLGDTAVILKMKDRHNENLAIYPPEFQEEFRAIWSAVTSRSNVRVSVTMEWDPLQMIAVSDVNVTLELSTPSTIAPLCGKPGFFFNTVEEFVYHAAVPQVQGATYLRRCREALVDAIRRCLDGGDRAAPLVEAGDLDGYNAGGDDGGLEPFRAEMLRHAALAVSS